jgi:3'-phosphoadenosine 5'-phosphosulfate sulfotransferase (PAPS reductase)/FAD synthetase
VAGGLESECVGNHALKRYAQCFWLRKSKNASGSLKKPFISSAMNNQQLLLVARTHWLFYTSSEGNATAVFPSRYFNIDTTVKFKEAYEFRDFIATRWKLNLIVALNTDAARRSTIA